jgi:hypothetical protein
MIRVSMKSYLLGFVPLPSALCRSRFNSRNDFARLLSAAIILTAVISVSADPLDNWTWRGAIPTTNPLNGIVYANGLFVAVGSHLGPGPVISSADGETWTAHTIPADSSPSGICFGNGRFVVVGDAGTVLVAADGKSWTPVASGLTNDLLAVCYGGGQFAAVGRNGSIATSPDALTWQARNSVTNQDLSAIAFGNGRFVAVGVLGTMVTSTDGVAWSLLHPRKYSDYDGFTDVTFANGIFVAGGSDPVLVSADGLQWTNTESPTAMATSLWLEPWEPFSHRRTQ